jgi:hypothetical protein
MKKKERKIKGLNNRRARELAAPRGLKSCRRNQPAMDNNIIVSGGRNDF